VRSDYRLPEIHYQHNPLRDFYFLVYISTVGINSKLFPWHVLSVQETSPNFLRRPYRIVVSYAGITQSQAANHRRLLSHVTLGLVECKK